MRRQQTAKKKRNYMKFNGRIRKPMTRRNCEFKGIQIRKAQTVKEGDRKKDDEKQKKGGICKLNKNDGEKSRKYSKIESKRN